MQETDTEQHVQWSVSRKQQLASTLLPGWTPSVAELRYLARMAGRTRRPKACDKCRDGIYPIPYTLALRVQARGRPTQQARLAGQERGAPRERGDEVVCTLYPIP